MPFPKPAEGSWTQHYPHLGTGPISFDDSITLASYELERKAIFERTWLNVGRVERLPRKGSYFTKEIAAARTSVILVRGADGQVRAFHNICRHRGNKLVWDEHPEQETKGTCRQFVCKYHAWRYSLEGDLSFVQQESEFFDLDKQEFGLITVQVEVWEGFIFVNLNPDNTTSLIEFLGPLGEGLVGYPFGEMTDTYSYRAEVRAAGRAHRLHRLRSARARCFYCRADSECARRLVPDHQGRGGAERRIRNILHTRVLQQRRRRRR
jgi:nitrite reductase/ring-hydroxylating ferredoxin subunit